MSILVVRLVPEGLLFGADRNITAQVTLSDGTEEIIVRGQSERPKVLKWPNREVILGYVGAADFGGEPADEWLYAFIGRNLDANTLDAVSTSLTVELNTLSQDGRLRGPSILHLGGFELVEGGWTPRVHFVRNTLELKPNGIYTWGEKFVCSEELSQENYFGARHGPEIQELVRTGFFSFRQGYDLGSFGAIDQKLREALDAIIHSHPAQPHQAPTTLRDWAKHVALAIHGYGAYFAAFYPPFEQYVGGGADVVWAAWPAE
ncbi:MAG: hypothetical protein WBP81_20240 [Solirubrobacteraceae bacterium]